MFVYLLLFAALGMSMFGDASSDFSDDTDDGNGGADPSANNDPGTYIFPDFPEDHDHDHDDHDHPATAVSSYTSGEAGGFNIDIDFEGNWTAEEQAAFIEASEFISDLIVDDIPADLVQGEVVDDLLIKASKESIDGRNNILGYAQVFDIRDDTSLPSGANLVFDSSDVNNLLNSGNWDTTVMHEMFHALGVGVVWDRQGLIDGLETSDPRFTGENANAAYQQLYDVEAVDPNWAKGIPLQPGVNGSGAGTHWNESVFDDEFMTGIIDGHDHVSVMTVAALEDMGYDTVLDDITVVGDAIRELPAIPA